MPVVMTRFKKITKNDRLGFIGLGHLGSPMARRLLSAGFPLVVYNRDRNKTRDFVAFGAEVASDPAHLAATADVVLSCVADGAAVEAVYLGAGGVLRNAKPGARIIEMSTVAPETSRKLYQSGRDLGISAPWPGAFLAPRTRARAIIRSAPRTSFRWSHFLPPTCRIPLLSGFRRGMHVMTAPRAS